MKTPKLKNKKIFIFDWSGTLSDDRIPVQTAFNRVATELGLKPTKTLNAFLKTAVKKIEVEFSNQLLGKISPEEVWALYTRHFAKLSNEGGVRPIIYKDVIQVLDFLKNKQKKIIVLSSHPHKNLLKEAKEYKIEKYFDKVTGSILNKAKGIHESCNEMGINTKEAVYIGDMIGDIKAAKEAKTMSVAIVHGYHSREVLLLENPDILINKLSELERFL